MPEVPLEEKVNEALRSMLHDALSGRPASKIVLQEAAVNKAIGSMLHDAFSGRPASKVFSSLLGEGGGSEDGAAGRVGEPPISTAADEDDSRLAVAYDDDFARAADVDWSKVRARTTTD